MTHHLKTLPEYFQAVIDGKKPMEFRYNDRGFKPGDNCILEEFTGTLRVPACPDRDTCRKGWHTSPEEGDYFVQPEECKEKNCESYIKELYTGRRCLVKIKDIFDLSDAGFIGYVAFTYDILNVIDKGGAE